MKHMGPMLPMVAKTWDEMGKAITPKPFNTIFVVGGDLDNEKLRQLPENIEGCILVTGNVNLSSSTVNSRLIVLGECMLAHTAVDGDLTAYGHFKAEGLIVYGTLCTKPEAEITGRVIVARHIYC